MPLVLKAEEAAVVVDVELGDAGPAELDHLVLERKKRDAQNQPRGNAVMVGLWYCSDSTVTVK